MKKETQSKFPFICLHSQHILIVSIWMLFCRLEDAKTSQIRMTLVFYCNLKYVPIVAWMCNHHSSELCGSTQSMKNYINHRGDHCFYLDPETRHPALQLMYITQINVDFFSDRWYHVWFLILFFEIPCNVLYQITNDMTNGN